MAYWIKTPAELDERYRQRPTRIGLDTEFIRERTYWPQLALVQMAVGDEILLIDPLIPGMNEALAKWLADTSITKVMHSASEDLVTFKVACGVLPRPLFDTQIAASLAGIGGGMGYQKLVTAITGVTLAKGETRSDWMRRPLSDAQLEYAADDVEYLFAIHDVEEAKLAELGRRQWLQDDAERLLASVEHDEERWPHVAMRSAQFMDAAAQRRLLRLLRWRDVQARASDKPRSWILDNELAALLARTPPADAAALAKVMEGFPKAPRKLATQVWEALDTPLHDEAEAPLALPANDANKQALKRLQDAVSARTAELGLPDGVLASRKHLESYLESRKWPQALAGWRQAVLEPVLAPLLPAAT
ncbi:MULTISPECIES: ribonuclease D [Stenotrophomonas]|uniref:Ribonuclease D n=1 Tax=Stenotrophomonas aracearum TaxID=3003272 RepID=A0ABY9Y9L5_9GAMM|nr:MULTISPECIES: ribonuclease D [unclassified Stenotrophomonas]WNH47562.1 ribonuclease D [Stenotrophomonas sp. A5588]